LSGPSVLECADCGRPWDDATEPRWRARLSDDGTGCTSFYCSDCMQLRALRAQPLYSLQFEFRDGRWSVGETRLPERPKLGDVIDVGGDGTWEVCGSKLVHVRPANKPPREFFVCRPAVAA
jgi:hypothetical protein